MSDNRKLTTGCKIWFWFLLIGDLLFLLMLLLSLFNSDTKLNLIAFIQVVVDILGIIGPVLILFKQKKAGLGYIHVSYACALICNLIRDVNILPMIIPAVIGIVISYLLVKKNADVLE